MLEEFGAEIWTAQGPDIVAAAGFHYPTRMAVVRLKDGGLWVWSPVTLTPELRQEVEALGPVSHVVAPNALHHMALPDWQSAFPDAAFYAAPGVRKKRPDISFAGDLGDAAPQAWAGQLDQAVMRGNAIAEEVVFFHVRSGTVLFTDLLQQLPDNWFSGWRAVVARLDLMTQAEPTVPRKFRLAFTKRKAARGALRRVLAWPARKVLMAHGEPVVEEGQAFLRRAFAWMKI